MIEEPTLETRLCPECNIGTLLPEVIDHVAQETIKGKIYAIVVPELTVGRCPWCRHIDLDASVTSWPLVRTVIDERNRILRQICESEAKVPSTCPPSSKVLTDGSSGTSPWLYSSIIFVLLGPLTIMIIRAIAGGR